MSCDASKLQDVSESPGGSIRVEVHALGGRRFLRPVRIATGEHVASTDVDAGEAAEAMRDAGERIATDVNHGAADPQLLTFTAFFADVPPEIVASAIHQVGLQLADVLTSANVAALLSSVRPQSDAHRITLKLLETLETAASLQRLACHG